MYNKRRKIILYAIPALIIISIACLIGYRSHSIDAKCDSNDPKIIALYDANNKLNRLLCDKNFGDIYDLYMETRGNKIIIYEYEIGGNKETFIKDNNDNYHWALNSRKMLSYSLWGDYAMTVNEVKTRHAITFYHSSKDILFNYWRYNSKEWNLIYFDRYDSTYFREPLDTTIKAN